MYIYNIIMELIFISIHLSCIRLMFYLGIHYWLGNKGAMCSDVAAPPVTDKAECVWSFNYLKGQYPTNEYIGSPVLEGTWAHFPKGCVVLFGSSLKYLFFWNQHRSGTSHGQVWQVCKTHRK